MNLGHLQVRIDLDLDTHQLAVPFQIVDTLA
jgi:hypothetical protein